MYERSYGYRYNEAESGHAPDIAKRIRADIKQAVSERLLPPQWSYSVTSESFSGGQSIDVNVRDCADAWQPCDGTTPGTKHALPGGGWTATSCGDTWCAANNDSPHARAHDVLTEEARSAKMTLERIHNAYNHDGSAIQTDYFDVRYYGHVSFETADGARFRQAEADRKKARTARKDAAKPECLLTTYNPRERSRTTHLGLKDEAGKALLACGAVLRRSTFYDMSELCSKPITCSRCAKASEVST